MRNLLMGSNDHTAGPPWTHERTGVGAALWIRWENTRVAIPKFQDHEQEKASHV